MKLWHACQWGNREDGVNGWDTQCIVTAIDLKSAVEKAEFHFQQMDRCGTTYRDGRADSIYLMGDDGRPDGEPQLVTRIWVDAAANLMRYPSWHRHPETNEWIDHKTMYGEV